MASLAAIVISLLVTVGLANAPFPLGNPIALSGPCPDKGYAISAERRRCDKGGGDQRTGQCFHLGASKRPIRSTKP